jgi:predicted small integral membrane protein
MSLPRSLWFWYADRLTEYGAIVGATLTLPTYWGLILVSFLTLFVQFVGGCFWRTLCFILHQTRSTTDGLYHQQQIILRNAITAPNALWSLARSAVVWKSRVAAPLGRSAPLIFITTFHIICFSAAGLLSSQIASTRAGQALVDSTACGYPKQLPAIRTATALTTSSAELDVFNAQVLLGRFTLTKSQAYVRACYNGDSEETAECGHFVRRSLVGDQASVDMQAACPFGRDACMTKAFRVDSGLLDSNKDIGLNEPPKNSVSFRRVTTCAPIQVDRYASVWRDNLTEVYGKKTNTSIRFYEFGKSDTGCMAAQPEHTTNQTTFCISKWMRDYLPGAYNIV